jgi:hypothetical protein
MRSLRPVIRKDDRSTVWAVFEIVPGQVFRMAEFLC